MTPSSTSRPPPNCPKTRRAAIGWARPPTRTPRTASTTTRSTSATTSTSPPPTPSSAKSAPTPAACSRPGGHSRTPQRPTRVSPLDAPPPKFIYDQAAGTGKTHATVAAGHPGPDPTGGAAGGLCRSAATRFGPDDFTLAPEGATELTCPQGPSSTTAYRSQSGLGRTFRFTTGAVRRLPPGGQLSRARGATRPYAPGLHQRLPSSLAQAALMR